MEFGIGLILFIMADGLFQVFTGPSPKRYGRKECDKLFKEAGIQ